MFAAYNDITPYNHQLMLLFFNHPSGRESSREARSRSELETILNSPGFADAEALQVSNSLSLVLAIYSPPLILPDADPVRFFSFSRCTWM